MFLIQAAIWYCSRKWNKPYFWLFLSFGLLFVMSSFRDMNMGTDYVEYVPIYDLIVGGKNYDMEPGYVFLNSLMSLFTSHYCGLAMGVNLILMPSLAFFITQHVPSKYWQLCVMIFAANPYMFIQSTFNILRQACGIGFLLLASHFFIKKKWHWDFLFVIVAALFHKASIIGLIIPLFWAIRWKKKYWYPIVASCFAVSFLLGDTLISFFFNVIDFGGYAGYEASALNHPIYILGITAVALFLIDNRDRWAHTEIEQKFYDFYLFSLCFLLFAVKNDMIYRFYLIFAFISLPAVAIIWRSAGKLVRLGYVGYYTAFYMGYLLLIYLAKDPFYIPFRFCF